MQDPAAGAPPLACVPGAIEPGERPAHFALVGRLFGTLAETREALPDGYCFRFPADAFGQVARFVDNERKCCPFLRFEVEVPPGGDAVWLRLTGPEGTRAFLDAEFHLRD
jgi:hypothetical protein